MDLTAWTEASLDATRLRRMAVGWGVGSVAVAGLFAFLAVSAIGRAENEEPALDVELAAVPENEPEPEPEPEPQPAPEPEPIAKPIVRPGPRLPALAVPTAVPDDAPKESDDKLGDGGGADPLEQWGGPGDGIPIPSAAPPPPPPPPPTPPPPPRGPIRVDENVTPPQPLAMPAPGYPADAKAAGIEGTVIIKYVVTESGAVTNVQAVRGPSELFAVCIAAVSSWRFKPAVSDGRPVAVFRVAKFPFRIRT